MEIPSSNYELNTFILFLYISFVTYILCELYIAND